VEHTWPSSTKLQLLKYEHDKLTKQKSDLAQIYEFKMEYSRLVKEEIEKRPGFQNQRS
jgi:hypothetical protein